MAWTKRDIVKQAYAELGKADYEFDLQPEEMQHALRVLDGMAATWGVMGFRVGYAGGDGFGDIDAAALVPEFANEALYLNLAIRIAPSFGKAPSPVTIMAAREAKNAVLSRITVPKERTLTGYAGSGSFTSNLPRAPDGLTLGNDGNLELGEAN